MSNELLLAELGINLGRIKTSGKTTCPKCSHTRKKKTDPCLSVNIPEGLYRCHNCGWAGGVGVKESYEKKEYVKPIFNNRTSLSDKTVKFFQSRMISQDTLNHFKITESECFFPKLQRKSLAINFNYFRNEELINIKFRGPQKSFMMHKGSELIMYNLDSIRGLDVAYITEGEIDAMALHECGIPNAISVPNGATLSDNANLEYLDNCIDLLNDKKKIIIATDNDDPGRALKKELVRRLGAHRCYGVDFGKHKDANDYLMYEGKEALFLVMNNHIEMPIDGVISINDPGVWDELQSFFKSGLQRGVTTKCLREFDQLVSFVPGHTMAITGVPNHGKSLLSNLIMCSLAVNHGWKWAIFSPEHKPLSIYLAKLCEILLGKRLRQGIGFTQNEQDMAKEFMSEHFFFIEPENGDNTLDSIISKAEGLVFRKGIRGFILDPWNKIEHKMEKGESETLYISRALDQLIYFGQKNSVFNIIVAHPTKVKKKPNSQLYEIVNLYDIAGSANFFNKVDWGVSFYRNFDTGYNEIYVQKSKWEHLGKIGSSQVRFNMNNGRLCDMNGDWDNTNWIKPKEVQTYLFNPSEQEIPEGFDSNDSEENPF